MMATVRLFVAVEIDAALVDAAAALIAELRDRAVRLAPRARVTWLTADRLHLTLAFIGHIDPSRLPAVRQALQPPFTARPFTIGLRGLGAFPERGRPRVIWAGLERGARDLSALAGEVTTRLGSTGIAVDERPHQPHLTLARVREAGGLRTSTLFAGLEQVALGTMDVRAITLFESRLSPAGAIYQPVVKSLLRAARSESNDTEAPG